MRNALGQSLLRRQLQDLDDLRWLRNRAGIGVSPAVMHGQFGGALKLIGCYANGG